MREVNRLVIEPPFGWMEWYQITTIFHQFSWKWIYTRLQPNHTTWLCSNSPK